MRRVALPSWEVAEIGSEIGSEAEAGVAAMAKARGGLVGGAAGRRTRGIHRTHRPPCHRTSPCTSSHIAAARPAHTPRNTRMRGRRWLCNRSAGYTKTSSGGKRSTPSTCRTRLSHTHEFAHTVFISAGVIQCFFTISSQVACKSLGLLAYSSRAFSRAHMRVRREQCWWIYLLSRVCSVGSAHSCVRPWRSRCTTTRTWSVLGRSDPWACTAGASSERSSRTPCICRTDSRRHCCTMVGTSRTSDRRSHRDEARRIVPDGARDRIRILCICTCRNAQLLSTTIGSLHSPHRQWPLACRAGRGCNPDTCSENLQCHRTQKVSRRQRACAQRARRTMSRF